MTDGGAIGEPMSGAVLRRALGRIGRESAGAAMRLERAWPYGENGLLACYRAGDLKSAWSVLFAPRTGLPRPLLRSVRVGHAFRVPLAMDAVAFPALRDPELPRLKPFLRGAHDRDLDASVGSGAPISCRTRLLRYKPLRRALVRVQIETPRYTRTLYVKLLRERDLETIWATYAALAQGASPPVAFPEQRLEGVSGLVWERVRGTAFADLRGADAVTAAAAAGRALAALHGQPVVLPRRHPRRRELDTVTRWLTAARGLWPDEQRSLDACFAALAADTEAWPGPLVPSHRDFHEDQFVMRDGRAVLLDLDTAAMAERELDVSNFLTHLQRYRAAASLAQAFVSAYESIAWAMLDPRRMDFYRAAAGLRLACVYRFRAERSDASETFAAIAREAVSNLNPRRMVS